MRRVRKTVMEIQDKGYDLPIDEKKEKGSSERL